MLADSQGARILQLRVRGTKLDSLRTQLRMSQLLNDVELRPSNLPPSAILCVRRLCDPMPSSLHLHGHAVRPPQRWTQALVASLDECVRRAARPLRQPAPADADAVLFADRAEMLACLALDEANGLLAYRWWWRTLVPEQQSNRMVGSTWLKTPHDIPAALAYLAASADAVRIVRSMDEVTVDALLDAVLATFNLRDLASRMRAPMAATTDPRSASIGLSVDTESGTAVTVHDEDAPLDDAKTQSRPNSALSAPWSQRAPEGLDASLTPLRRFFLGVALSLVRDPGRVRARSFALAAHRWRQSENAEFDASQPADTKQPVVMMDAESDAIHHHRSLQKADRSVPRARGPETNATSTSPAADHDGAPEWTPQRTEAHSKRDDITCTDWAVGESVQALETDDPAVVSETELPISTAFGGLFYLLNLAVHLGFYADYAMPWKRELGLPIWDFVTLIGSELLGGTPSDPVWSLLTALAGRDDDTPPGSAFSPPDEWRVEPAWLDAFPEKTMRMDSSSGGWLRIRHPAGFLLAELPAADESELDDLRARYNVEIDRTPFDDSPAKPASPLRRWLNWLTPYVRARLRRALVLPKTEDPVAMLLRHNARIYVTQTQLDVMLSLDTLPIEIRLAGLDRDPGWLPAAGRKIRFHFESSGE